MKNLSREKLIETYIVAQNEGLADIFLQLIKDEMQSRQVTLEEVINYHKKQMKHYLN